MTILSERPTCSRGSGRVARPVSPGAPVGRGGRTHEGCGYVALYNDAFQSMDPRYNLNPMEKKKVYSGGYWKRF
ncbi:MAG: hypothetical protein KatS3mg042_0178 [Rhodothermaceae bacterium]|nr:MAG: hypothetical protein KatS3mg042_0178 [Rhodothermaceae bacterium]